MVLNQSACVFALGYFLTAISVQWLAVVDKIATFPCFSKVLKEH